METKASFLHLRTIFFIHLTVDCVLYFSLNEFTFYIYAYIQQKEKGSYFK